MRTAAILPVKRFGAAKQRLAASVTETLRLQLAAAMVADVLHALAESPALGLTILVTGEREVARTGLALGAEVVEDSSDSGQSAAVALGVQRALAHGFGRVLCVPGDCPAIDPGELLAVLAERTPAREVVIVPDRHGTSTNALLLRPPDVIAPSFGPDSFARHRELARGAGVEVRVERPPSLLLDIDTGADLQELRRRLAVTGPRAPRTRIALEQAAVPASSPSAGAQR